MDGNLVPKMRKIAVSPDKLILDPNNPRLISRREDRVDDANVLDTGIIKRTMDKMNGDGKDTFRINELVKSIKKNGWQPIDSIFVRKYEADRYIVLEGNRRVTAIINLLSHDDIEENLKNDLTRIEVMEIIEEGLSPHELEEKISYLLGVRHHGSLKPWSPFAQARNIYTQYKSEANQTDENFVWNEEYGEKIADALSIKPETVKDRLRVFRVMHQIGNDPVVKESEQNGGGMKDRYYSVCQEVITNRSPKLKDYIKQDPDTFVLDDESVRKMDNLCHFSTRGRKDAPINNPQQWRYLSNILADEDQEKRATMLNEVEVEKKNPDLVWAQRAEELRKLQWDKWLQKVALTLGGVTMNNIQETDEEKEVIEKLVNLLNQLPSGNSGEGGTRA